MNKVWCYPSARACSLLMHIMSFFFIQKLDMHDILRIGEGRKVVLAILLDKSFLLYLFICTTLPNKQYKQRSTRRISLFNYLSIYVLSNHLSFHLFICLIIYPGIYPSIYLSKHLSIYQSIFSSFYLSYLSIYLSINQCIHLSIHLNIYLYIHLPFIYILSINCSIYFISINLSIFIYFCIFISISVHLSSYLNVVLRAA